MCVAFIVQETVLSWDYLLLDNDDYVLDFAGSQLKAIIGALHKENAKCMKLLSITFISSSRRSAQAASAIKKNELKLAPVSTTVLATNSGNPKFKNAPETALATHNSLAFSGGRTGSLYIVPKYPVQTQTGVKRVNEFIVPFWAVNTTLDASVANMQINLEEIDVGDSDFVYVPMMHNTRAIKKGEELLLHQGHGRLSRWPIEPPAKQAKTAL